MMTTIEKEADGRIRHAHVNEHTHSNSISVQVQQALGYTLRVLVALQLDNYTYSIDGRGGVCKGGCTAAAKRSFTSA